MHGSDGTNARGRSSQGSGYGHWMVGAWIAGDEQRFVEFSRENFRCSGKML